MAIEKPPRKGENQNMAIYPSKGKALWWSTISLLWILAGIGIFHLGILYFSIMAGIPILVFPGLLSLLYFFPIVLQAFASSPMLVINDEGIQATIEYMSAVVKWEEISTIDLHKVGAGAWFEVTLSAEGRQSFISPQRTLSRSRRSRRLRSRIIIISQSVLPLSVKHLIETIQQRYQMSIEHYHIRIRL